MTEKECFAGVHFMNHWHQEEEEWAVSGDKEHVL